MASTLNGQLLLTPTKRLFVDMLTRDIELDDAILDLLDNCVDGSMRGRRGRRGMEQRYDGFHASLEFSGDEFKISDNCGGISDSLKESAFRLGRPFGAEAGGDLPTVGVYGIGMKRAIFKLGRECTIETRTKTSGFRVTIKPEWFSTEDDWALPVVSLPGDPKRPGTTITVKRLLAPVTHEFRSPTGFVDAFRAKVSQHYSVLIEKGFKVSVNGKTVSPVPITFKTSDFAKITEAEGGIAPYLFDGNIDGVDVELAIGFYSPFSEDPDEQPTQFKSDEAGWTVICNDRVVLYKDKTLLTGWGEGAPIYHPQFRQISGVVVFRSGNPELLPIKTTKRGIEANSLVYLRVRQKMRDGLKKFTNFTNKLKTLSANEREKMFESTSTVDLKTLRTRKAAIPDRNWIQDRKINGRTYDLPLPKVSDSDSKVIRFSKPADQIRRVSTFLFDDSEISPSDVGAAAFDRVLKEVRK
jgi:hypothetical protein